MVGEVTTLTKRHFEDAWELAQLIPRNPLFGFSIIESPFMGTPTIQFRWRTWKERLFSLPWQPMKRMAFYTVYKPKGELIIDKINHVIYGHPVDVANLKNYVSEMEQPEA